ncbi:MAG TPA: hypothetical protein VFY14_21015 [Streptomyces sp.]|nr:hypothetical protein [Streptomyces sp.]
MAVEGERDEERGHKAPLTPVPAPARGRGRGPRRFHGRTPGGLGHGPRERGRVRAFLGVVADRIIENAPRIPVRDLAALRAQFPGLGPEEIADRLISGAKKSSATVGAGVGAAAMLPVPPAMPAELATEVIAVASVELKLIAELHEVYGRRPPGNARERAAAYLTAWSEERGIVLTRPASYSTGFGSPLKRGLRHTLLRRTLRNLPNLTPFMIGSAVGALMNRRDTGKLAERIRRDLRGQRIAWDALPAGEGTVPDAGE